FLLAMGDHLVDSKALRRLVVQSGNLCVAADSSPRYVAVSEATRLALSEGRVVAVGKSLPRFDAVDMGFFVASRSIFPVLRECLDGGQCSLNEAKRAWMQAGNDFLSVDCSGYFWLDVDTPADRSRAERLLRQRLTKDRDGIVARLVNRPLSTRLSGWLVSRPVSSNEITMSSFGLSFFAAALLASGVPLLMASGGLLAQAASILDGCDGEVARLRGTATPGGAVFDAVLDRLADAMVIAGLVWGARSAGGGDTILALGALALSASLVLSYSESRFESAFGRPLPAAGARIPATRDVRVFLVMLGGLFNVAPLALAAIAALSGAEIVRRLRQAVALAVPGNLGAG
ncbi:MAG: CDP-alcohol phosphatidyltransferase family protein, partial [Anaerolineae bacterium]